MLHACHGTCDLRFASVSPDQCAGAGEDLEENWKNASLTKRAGPYLMTGGAAGHGIAAAACTAAGADTALRVHG